MLTLLAKRLLGFFFIFFCHFSIVPRGTIEKWIPLQKKMNVKIKKGITVKGELAPPKKGVSRYIESGDLNGVRPRDCDIAISKDDYKKIEKGETVLVNGLKIKKA